MRLLLVEDEIGIGKPIKRALEENGFAVDWVEDGIEGESLAKINSYDTIILDLNLPGKDGLEVSKDLRKEGIITPILMLTARVLKDNMYEGFDAGADDYLTKPFAFKELLYRIHSLVKRNSEVKEELLKVEDIALSAKDMKVFKKDKEIELNNKEFGILEYLLRNRGRCISQEELLEHVWDQDVDTFTQTVRTNIKTLRKKIDTEKRIVKTVTKKGYIIN